MVYRKTMPVAGAMLLLTAIFATTTVAHNTDGDACIHPGTGLEIDGPYNNLDNINDDEFEGVFGPDTGHPYGNNLDDCRLDAANSYVSGRYVGPAGPYVELIGPTVFTVDPNGTPGDDDDLPLNPSFLLAGGFALCDLEVLSDGNETVPPGNPDAAGDETNVDGNAGQTGTPLNASVPDGLWDDGGFGAACHTPKTHYDDQDYNTAGCSGRSVLARAEDAVVGGEVWIGTACDFTNPVNNTFIVEEFLLCAINNVITSNAEEIVVCVNNLIACATGAVTCDPLSDAVSCGGDGAADAGYFGEGSGHTGHDHLDYNTSNDPFDLHSGPGDVWYADDTGADGGRNCSDNDDSHSEAVFTFVGGVFELTDTNDLLVHDISVPTTGWIDSILANDPALIPCEVVDPNPLDGNFVQKQCGDCDVRELAYVTVGPAAPPANVVGSVGTSWCDANGDGTMQPVENRAQCTVTAPQNTCTGNPPPNGPNGKTTGKKYCRVESKGPPPGNPAKATCWNVRTGV